MDNMIDKYSVVFAIVAFLGFIAYKIIKKQDLKLEDVVMVIIAAGMLPVTIAIIIYPLFPSIITSIEEMKLQLVVMGLVLFYVYAKVIIKKLLSNNS